MLLIAGRGRPGIADLNFSCVLCCMFSALKTSFTASLHTHADGNVTLSIVSTSITISIMNIAKTSSSNVQKPENIIDTITYLASLVSDPQAIDPVLDTLRVITSEIPAGAVIQDQQLDELRHVQEQLKNHLLHNDPVRLFAAGDLEKLIAKHVGDAAIHTPAHDQTLRQVGVIGVAMGVTYLVAGVTFSFVGVHLPWILAGLMAMVTMYIGLIWFYWSSLETFTKSLRQAYFWIVVGIALMGIASPPAGLFVTFPTIMRHTILSYAGAFPLFSLSFFFVYFGLCIFARTVQVRSPLISLRLCVPAVVILALATTLVPHNPNFQELPLVIGVITLTSMSSFGLLAGFVAFTIRRKVTDRYSRALTLFGIAYALAGAVMVVGTTMSILAGPLAGLRMAVVVVPSMIAGLLVFLSGYYFKLSVDAAQISKAASTLQ